MIIVNIFTVCLLNVLQYVNNAVYGLHSNCCCLDTGCLDTGYHENIYINIYIYIYIYNLKHTAYKVVLVGHLARAVFTHSYGMYKYAY